MGINWGTSGCNDAARLGGGLTQMVTAGSRVETKIRSDAPWRAASVRRCHGSGGWQPHASPHPADRKRLGNLGETVGFITEVYPAECKSTPTPFFTVHRYLIPQLQRILILSRPARPVTTSFVSSVYSRISKGCSVGIAPYP